MQLTLSVLESLARLPALEQEAILAGLSEDEAERLQHDWSFLRGQASFSRLAIG